MRFGPDRRTEAPRTPSILKQIVKLLLALFFGVGLGGDAAGALENVAHLKTVAEVGFLFVGDIGVDSLTALEPTEWIKKPTAAAAAQIGQTVGAAVVARYAADQAGRATATPAD